MGRPKHNRTCSVCKEPIDRHANEFCSAKCQNQKRYIDFIVRWKLGLEKGTRGKQLTSKHIHRYLREKNGDKCSKCGWNKINPTTNKVPIQLHHKDGNQENNNEDNLELLCPNCHSLTPTFMNLNKGKGRKERYKTED